MNRPVNSPLSLDLIQKMDAYWRAANYLSVGQIYLYDNPLLKIPLSLEHVKPRLLGHWGTTPGLNFIYVHLNRIINQHDLNILNVTGPGHGGPGLVANTYLEGSYTELYPDISQDEPGMKKLFTQFSFPGGIPSHVAAETPGSINEDGELGYCLSHAYGAAFDNPDLLVACVVGDGKAETGPLATSWHSNKFLNPVHDGAVLPILHLNGYKIAGPTVLARIPRDELESLFRGYGYTPHFVEGDDPMEMHQLMAGTLDTVIESIRHIQKDARATGLKKRPLWPMIILRSPKGWTGPKEVDGKQTEGTNRSHQVPMGDMSHPGHVKILEEWLESYRPHELFDKTGRLRPELAELAPRGPRRMGANPHANDGLLLRDLHLPDFRDYAVKIPKPGSVSAEATRVQGELIRVYLPPDANTLLSVTDHCLRSRNYVNVIVAGKQPSPQWLDMDAAIRHCTAGLGIWEWASNDDGSEPDLVMACAGDVPTMETLAAVELLRQHLPALKIRVVNVVDLMTLQSQNQHPHGLSDEDFDALFTRDKPIIFAYHGYPSLIHKLTYRRANHHNLHVHGFKEEGTTTTPFDMVVLNKLDRFHLATAVIERVPGLGPAAAALARFIGDKLLNHESYIRQHGEDMPEIRDWKWGANGANSNSSKYV